MSTNKNVFANKIMTVYDELYQTHNLLAAVIVNLERCLKEGDDVNLTKEIGIYATEMPEFLKDSSLMTGIRKICTGELIISDAIKEANHYMDMLKEVLDCFDESGIYNLSNDDKEKCTCSDKDSDDKSECECGGGCKCGDNCECNGSCGCGCECERDSEEVENPELASDEDFHLEISIKGSKNVLSALLL